MKARREDRSEIDIVFIALGDQLIASFGGDLEWFFDQDMFAGSGRCNTWFKMCTAGGADRHDVDRGIFEHRLKIIVGESTELRAKSLGLGFVASVAGDEP